MVCGNGDQRRIRGICVSWWWWSVFNRLKESYETGKAEFKKFLVASEEKLVDVEHRIQAFEHTRYTVEELLIKVDEAEAKLKNSEEHVRFIENKVSKQRNYLLWKDVYSSGYRERVVALKQ